MMIDVIINLLFSKRVNKSKAITIKRNSQHSSFEEIKRVGFNSFEEEIAFYKLVRNSRNSL